VTQPYKICPDCNEPAAVSSASCLRCGRVYRTTAPALTHVFHAAPHLPVAPSRKASTFPQFLNWCGKWGAVAWSVFCVYGVYAGMSAVAEQTAHSTRMQNVSGLATGVGMIFWAFIWLAVAGPCGLIYMITRPKTAS
jgi:hypothetical protein